MTFLGLIFWSFIWFYQPGNTTVIPRYYRVGKTKSTPDFFIGSGGYQVFWILLLWNYDGFTMGLRGYYHGFTVVLSWFHRGITVTLSWEHLGNFHDLWLSISVGKKQKQWLLYQVYILLICFIFHFCILVLTYRRFCVTVVIPWFHRGNTMVLPW